MLFSDGCYLLIVHSIGLIDLLSAMLVHLFDVLEVQMTVSSDSLFNNTLSLLIGLVDYLTDLLFLLKLSLSDRKFLLVCILSLKLLEALLDLLDDLIGVLPSFVYLFIDQVVRYVDKLLVEIIVRLNPTFTEVLLDLLVKLFVISDKIILV